MSPPRSDPQTPARPGRLRRCVLRLGLVLGSLVGALGAAEVGLRLAGIHVPPRGDVGMQGLVHPVSADVAPGVEFSLVPDQERTASYPGAPGEEPRVVTYRINPQGFRGRPTPPAKPEGVFRIAVLGDSVTYGTGVDQGETWPHLLEQRLNGGAQPGRFEVLNWAVPAYNTRQQVGLLNLRAPTFQPDLVLLCAYINDASGEDRGREREEAVQVPWEVRWVQRLGLTSGRWDEGAPMTPAQRRTMFLRERSRLADLAAFRLHGWLLGRVSHRNYVEDWSPGSRGLRMVESSLSAAVVVARREGLALHATMYPDVGALGEPYGFADQHRTFAGLCAELDIPFHDLLPALAGEDPQALRAHAHDKHPNGRAHGRVAERLAELLAPHLPGG